MAAGAVSAASSNDAGGTSPPLISEARAPSSTARNSVSVDGDGVWGTMSRWVMSRPLSREAGGRPGERFAARAARGGEPWRQREARRWSSGRAAWSAPPPWRRSSERGCDVVALSRRAPEVDSDRPFRHLPLDLRDAAACRAALTDLPPGAVTHVVYAAVSEAPGLVQGWRDRERMELNLAMLRNVLDPLCEAGRRCATSACCRARRRTAPTSTASRCRRGSGSPATPTRTSTGCTRTTSGCWPTGPAAPRSRSGDRS